MDRVLITGGAGFIGRQVARDLLDKGYRVRILDAFVPQVHGDHRPPVPDAVETAEGDVRDPQATRSALSGIDAVVHLAAEVGVGQSMYEIARYVGANDLGTATLLESMIGSDVRRIVVASSMSVYGEGAYRSSDGRRWYNVRRDRAAIRDGHWNPVDERKQPLEPIPTDETKPVDLSSIYALTKYVQERSVLLFGEAYGIDAVALRLFNVFGPGQALSNPYTGVLANFSARLASGERPMIFEDGEQRRDFVHVRDVAKAFRLALESDGAAGKVFNIGSGTSRSVASIAVQLADAMDRQDLQPEILGRARSGDIRNCFADLSLARDVLGFAPEHQLEDCFGEIIDWVRTSRITDRGSEMRTELETRGLVS